MKKTLLFAFAAVTLSCSEGNEKELQAQRDSLQTEVDNLRVEMDSLILKNRKYEFQHPEISKEEIVEQLREKTDLIPMEPVLGGTMRFGNIEIIDESLIVTDYNDGHVEGSSIFKYEVEGTEINFKEVYTIKK